jgi:hypothetical protein
MAQIPPPSDVIWNKLVTGQVSHKFSLFAANMLLAHAVRTVAANPSRTPAVTKELHQFCSKYADLVADELQTLR